MIVSSDILHILFLAEKYVGLAEQIRNRAVKMKEDQNVKFSELDRFRRNAVFIGNVHSDFATLASYMMEMEQLRSQLDTLKARLSAYSAASCAYISTLYEQFSNTPEVLPLARMGSVIQRLTSIFKIVNVLGVESEGTLIYAVKTDAIITMQLKNAKTLQVIYFGKQIKNLIATLS